MWAAAVYLEAVSVYPQLRMMQRGRVVERFTAHYVFALGLSRFFNCAHWALKARRGRAGMSGRARARATAPVGVRCASPQRWLPAARCPALTHTLRRRPSSPQFPLNPLAAARR